MAKKEFGSKAEKILGNYVGNTTVSTSAKRKTTEGTIKRAYYLTPEQDKAIAMKAAMDGIKKNEVVQEALNQYLSDYLK